MAYTFYKRFDVYENVSGIYHFIKNRIIINNKKDHANNTQLNISIDGKM